MIEKCKVCDSSPQVVAYEGPVRHGVFGRAVQGVIYECKQCGVQYLPPMVEDLKAYYQGCAYREEVGESAHVSNYFRLHDAEQLRKYGLLEEVPLRGKVIADVGCAGGSFLDGVGGFASATIGIEPAVAYHHSLQERGHLVYPDISSALSEWRGRVDLAVCFSVIEHISEPVNFLREMRALLTDGGCLLISTPNRSDILLELGCNAYLSFFYRTVHVYYFNEKALRTAAQAAGFHSFNAKYMHRFNFANALAWLQHGKPIGNSGQTPLGTTFDNLWQTMLEERRVADYLYAYLRK